MSKSSTKVNKNEGKVQVYIVPRSLIHGYKQSNRSLLSLRIGGQYMHLSIFIMITWIEKNVGHCLQNGLQEQSQQPNSSAKSLRDERRLLFYISAAMLQLA